MKKNLILFSVIMIGFVLFAAYAKTASFSIFSKDNGEKTNRYEKSQTISIKECYEDYSDKEKRGEITLNRYGDVVCKNKIVLTPGGSPLNEKNALEESIIALKIMLIAKGTEIRENCNPDDTFEFGEVGCYFHSEDNP